MLVYLKFLSRIMIMKPLFICLTIAFLMLVLSNDSVVLLDSMLHQVIYIGIFAGGVMYVARCFRRACIDK